MNESNSIKEIDKTNFSEQTKFRLSGLIGIENYFHQEINQRKSNSKEVQQLEEYQLFHLQVLLELLRE